MQHQLTLLILSLASTIIATPLITTRQDAAVAPFLDLHNEFRAERGAPPMVWNNENAGKAWDWANKCVFEHSGGTLGPFGGEKPTTFQTRLDGSLLSRKLGGWDWRLLRCVRCLQIMGRGRRRFVAIALIPRCTLAYACFS